VDGLIPTPEDHAEYAQEECMECHRPTLLMTGVGEELEVGGLPETPP
jgi:hypothetical protein